MLLSQEKGRRGASINKTLSDGVMEVLIVGDLIIKPQRPPGVGDIFLRFIMHIH